MRAGLTLEERVRHARRIGVGIIEILPEEIEDRSLATLKQNLGNRLSAMLVAIVVAAQLADVVTTFRALSAQSYVENNPLLRALIVRSPLAAYTVKLLLVSAVVLLVLSRLRGRRAQVALAVAGGISLIAPVLNLLLITHV
jgi:Domain of unknown function (DUF5658)